MSPRIEGGLLLTMGVLLGAALVHVQSWARAEDLRVGVRELARAAYVREFVPSAPLAAAAPPERIAVSSASNPVAASSAAADSVAPSPAAPSPVVASSAAAKSVGVAKPVVVAKTIVLAKPAYVAKSALSAKPITKSAPERQSLRAAGNRLKHVPSSALAKLRRGDAGFSKGLARELAAGTRALERGKAYTAYSHFLRGSQLDPKSADAQMGIALCHYELEQRGAMRRALAKVFALNASHPEASILSGFIAQLAGKRADAVEWYRRALGGVEETEVADELRSVISQLEPADSTPTATALAK